MIHIHRSKKAFKISKPFSGQLPVLLSDLPAAAVDKDAFTGFSVFKFDESGRRQLHFPGIGDGDTDQIMAPGQDSHVPAEVRRDKVGDNKNNSPFPHDPTEKIKGYTDIGPGLAWPEMKNFPDQPQDMGNSFFVESEGCR